MKKEQIKIVRDHRGFTMIELLISLGITSIITISFSSSYASHMKYMAKSLYLSEAIEVSKQVLDQIRLSDPSTLPSSGTHNDQSIKIGPRTYTTTVSYCENNSFCFNDNIKHIVARVYKRGKKIYETETIFTKLQ